MAQLMKNPQCGRPGFNPWVEKIPWEGKGYPLQYSGLENSMDCIVHGVAKSRTRLSDFSFFRFSRVEVGGASRDSTGLGALEEGLISS